MIRFNTITWEAMDRPRPTKIPQLPRNGPRVTYKQALDVFNDNLEELLNNCSRHVDEDDGTIIHPAALLKEVAQYLHSMTRKILPYECAIVEEEMKKMPFRYTHDFKDQFVVGCFNCHLYPGIVAKLYGGIFSCHNQRAAEQDETYLDTRVITDVDLLCVFVAMVSLQKYITMKVSAIRKKIFLLIFESLKIMKEINKDEWKKWPYTRLAGGSKARDRRTFDALCGFDIRDGRENDWISVSMAYIEHTRNRELESTKKYINKVFDVDDEGNGCGNNSTIVYVGTPVYDMVQFLPLELHELLFGEKLVKVLQLCYNYSISNMPYVLASDTHPVIADDFPPIVPSGCKKSKSGGPLLSTNNLTLVSRHAIPSARKLGIYLLDRESSLEPFNGLGRAVAECMVHSSIEEQAAKMLCPASEIKCMDRHITCLFLRTNENTEERCGVCDKKLNFDPHSRWGTEAAYDYFPLHGFMDTFESVNRNCSASLCPDCLIRTVLFTYEKVSSGSVAISNAFKCPCCSEYMINFLGRGSEVSKLCDRLLCSYFPSSHSTEESTLHFELVKRIETCFSSLEMLQNDFMMTALSSTDFSISKESKFFIYEHALRPAVPRYKLMEGERYSLNCIKCVSPLCCDKPDEYLDIETVDVVPPVTPYPPPLNDPYYVDVEDIDFDGHLPTDEMLRYDDGPGTHRWPARLSCGFISSNALQGDEEIETCAEAIAVLGRIPQKKRRGWNSESPEGKAIIGLANWYKKNQPPENMQQLLTAVASIFKNNDCLCVKAAHHPFRAGRIISYGVVSQIKVSEIPLVAAYFKAKNKNRQDGQPLMEYASLFTRNLISECLLQMPQCVYHRASSFVLTYANPEVVYRMRPDEAAKLDYVISLNVTRRNMAIGNSDDSSISYTAKQERTVEWAVEKGGEQLKIVTCFNCKTPTIKNGGCVTMTCGVCAKLYCWLCEKPIRNSDHTLIEHGLLYCTSAVARKAFEDLYNVEITTLQLHKFESMDAYVMEDGYTFDTSTNRAVRIARIEEPST